jgi:nucleotide-binding universal stress UspA family protein
MKTILVPVDFSEEASNAAHYAAHLAKVLDAELTLLYVFHIPIPITEAPYPVDFSYLEKENNGMLRELAAELQSAYQIKPKLKLVPGFAVEEILDEIKEERADLVVMGTNSADDKFRFLFGSTSASVMRISPVPILVIPSGVSFKAPQRILLAFDSSDVKNPDIFKPLIQLCFRFNSTLALLNIVSPGQFSEVKMANARDQFTAYLPGIEQEIYFEENEDVESGLNKFLKENPSDMLVVLPHEHGFLERLFTKTYSKNLSLHSGIPVLALHDGTERVEIQYDLSKTPALPLEFPPVGF